MSHERHLSLMARGRRLEYLTFAWNGIEAAVALASGVVAGSVALVGFGLDSIIEMISAGILLWRLRSDDSARRERDEQRAHRLAGACLFALAVYIAVESARALWFRSVPEHSMPGVAIAIAALAVMPVLGHAKRRIAQELHSRALHSDSRQADFCAYLSAVLLLGLLLNWLFGWWWADAVAALIMVPIIAREGVQALRGKACDDCC